MIINSKFFQPEGPIYTAMMTYIKNENDMNSLFDPENPIYEQCIHVLCQNVEEIVQRITEFMVKTKKKFFNFSIILFSQKRE